MAVITSYQYKILHYIRRCKVCSLEKLTRKFGRGVSATLDELDKYLDYTSTVLSGDGYVGIGAGESYALSDDGYAAVAEYSFIRRSNLFHMLLGYIAGVLSTVAAYVITEYLLPLILQ